MPGLDSSTRPTAEPEPEPDLPVVDIASEPIDEAKPEPPAPDTGWYRLIAEATGRPVAGPPSSTPVETDVVTETGPGPTQIATKGPRRRRTLNSRRPQSTISATLIEADTEPKSEPKSSTLQNAVEPASEIEVEAETERAPVAPIVGEVESRWSQLLTEVSDQVETTASLAPLEVEAIAEPVPQPTPTTITGRLRRATVIGPIDVPETAIVEDDVEVDDEVATIAEVESESELNLAKRRLLRRAAEYRIAAPPPAATIEVEPESASVPVEPLEIVEPDVTVEIEVVAEPLAESPAPTSNERVSRWSRLLAVSTEIDTEPSAGPVDVESIAEPETVEPTPKRIKGFRRYTTTTEPQIESATSINVEAATELASQPVAPAVDNVAEPIAEVEVATVFEAQTESELIAPAPLERVSRWSRLLAVSTEIDTEPSAEPVDVETIAEPETVEPTPKRIRVRRRRTTTTEPQIESATSINVEAVTELASQTVAPAVDNVAEPIAEVEAEVEIATVFEAETESEPIAPTSNERVSRWSRLLGASTEIDTEPSAGPVDVETIAEPETVEPAPKRIRVRRRRTTTTEPQIESTKTTDIEAATELASQTVAPAVDNVAEPIAEVEAELEVATVIEAEPLAELPAPTSVEPASRWSRLLGASSEIDIDTEPSAGPVDVETIAEPETVGPAPRRIRGRRRRTRAERQIDAVTEPDSPSIDDIAEPIAEDDVEVGLAVEVAPVAEVEAEAETWSEPVAPPQSVGRWNQLLAASGQDDTEPSGPVDVETIAELEIAEPVVEVEIEVATVIEPETESEPIAPASVEPASRWNRLLGASSEIDTEPSAGPVDVETIAESALQQTSERIKGRRRRTRAARQIDAITEPETAEPIAVAEVQDVTETETASESAATAIGVAGEPIAEVEVEAVETPPAEHRRNRAKRRPRRAKTDRGNVTALPATIKLNPAEVITSTEPESTHAGSLADIAIEPISELVTVLPVVDTSVVETALVETAVIEGPVEDAPTILPASVEPVRDVISEPPAKKSSRWRRRAADRSHDIVPPAAIVEVDIEVEFTSIPDTPLIEVETDDVAGIETSVDDPTPSTAEPVEPSPLVDLAPESSAAHDLSATAEPVTEARRETTPNATQGRWDRLIAETAVGSTPAPPSDPAPNTIKRRGWRRERAERQIDADVAPVVTDVGLATADPIVEVATAPIAESESESTTSSPQGRWDRLVAESAARTAAAPSPSPAPVPKKSTKRQRLPQSGPRRDELPAWVARLESEVRDEPSTEPEAATAPLPTRELQPREPLPFVVGAAELIADVDLEPSTADPAVEATIETRADTDPAPTGGRWERLRADARSRARLVDATGATDRGRRCGNRDRQRTRSCGGAEHNLASASPQKAGATDRNFSRRRRRRVVGRTGATVGADGSGRQRRSCSPRNRRRTRTGKRTCAADRERRSCLGPRRRALMGRGRRSLAPSRRGGSR